MKRLIMAGAALAALAGFATSAAASPDGWYGALDIGGHEPFDSHGTQTNGEEFPLFQNTDWAYFGRVGYQFTPNWRLEIEGSFRQDKTRHADGFSTSGHYDDGAGMVNLIYDVAPEWKVHPFFGVGIGADKEYVKEQASTGLRYVSSGQTEFAFQGLGGLTWATSDRLNVDFTYRYLNGGKFHLNCQFPAACPIRTTDYQDNSVSVGLRYAFGPEEAPPPPPPPPPAFVAKDFVVYFPFDQYALTPEAQDVVKQAAQYATDGHATRIVVVGHTDTSGSVKYNLRLSERRAKAVADALVGLGVGQDVMKVDWVGKTDLAVPTPDGVKEPLNRRSTISINF